MPMLYLTSSEVRCVSADVGIPRRPCLTRELNYMLVSAIALIQGQNVGSRHDAH